MLILNCVHEQCDHIWQNLTTLAKILKSLAILLRVNVGFGTISKHLWAIF